MKKALPKIVISVDQLAARSACESGPVKVDRELQRKMRALEVKALCCIF